LEVRIKTLSIKKDYEFRRIYKKGRSYVNPAIVVYILKNKNGVNRVGITTSRKIGDAVHRNRARRIIREAYRALEGRLPAGYDFVFVARGRTCSLKTQNVQRVMGGIFASAKLFEEKKKPGENREAPKADAQTVGSKAEIVPEQQSVSGRQ
jgi:ribonuclease P protein component, eubacterial